MTEGQRKGDETQATKTALSKLKRAWKSVAIVAVVGLLILGELTFQWAKYKGWAIYTEDDGLVDNFVRSIAVAPDGALWFGTGGGVSRFDGQTWTTYTEDDGLAYNDVWSIAVAPDGALWSWATLGLGQEVGGISRFDRQMWTTYTTGYGRAVDQVRAIAVAPDGVLWFGTEGGVSRFDGQTWTTYTTRDGLAWHWVNAIAVAPDGALWFGTSRGASHFDGETWTTYGTSDGLASREVTAIAVTPDGVLWFGTGGGVSRFDGQNWTTYREEDGLADNWVDAMVVDGEGALWFGTSRGGISRFDGETWATYTPTNSGLLAHMFLTDLAVDEQGRVWVGTTNGLSVLDVLVALPAQILKALVVFRAATRLTLVLLVIWLIGPAVVRRRRRPARVPAAPTVGAPSPASAAAGPGPPLAGAPFKVPADPQAAFERGQSLARQGQRAEAVICFMAVFRDGPPDLRRQALAELEKLGEVETH